MNQKQSLDEIVWKPIALCDDDTQRNRKKPMLTVDVKSGRLTFNVAACQMFPEIFLYTNALVLKGDTGKESKEHIGFLFAPGEIPETAYPLKKVIGANDKVSSCYISSRHIARMLNKTEQRTCHLELYKCSNSVLAVMEAV